VGEGTAAEGSGGGVIIVTENRIITLDVIRGIAVMGIFSVNVIAFAMIEAAYFNPGAMGGYTGANLAIWFANFIIIDGKMRSLFSMLFGASMLLVIDRAYASGRSGVAVHFRRMIVLAAFGLAHFYFVWFGDILFLYAVTGCIAFFFRNRAVPTLLAWSGGLFVISFALLLAVTNQIAALDRAAHAPDATAQQVRAWNQTVSFVTVNEAEKTREVALGRSSFGFRAHEMLTRRASEPFKALSVTFAETLALMLLGMAAFRMGYLTGEWPDDAYRRIALFTLAIAIPASALLGAMDWMSGFFVPGLMMNFMVLGTPLRPMMAMGYAALIILIFRKPGAFRDRVAAVGRCAFTNYLGTSILASLIFFGDGLGLFGRFSRFEAWLFAPLFWAIMLAWSKPWLDRFHYGPFEWLWRSLSRMKLQPMRKLAPATV
jgi:uncharacterized protein